MLFSHTTTTHSLGNSPITTKLAPLDPRKVKPIDCITGSEAGMGFSRKEKAVQNCVMVLL
jgi:hypothetical protein